VRSLLIPAVITAFPRFIVHSECEKEKGLLNGIPDVRNAKDYARKINLRDAGDLLKNINYLYNSAVEDVRGDTNELKNIFKIQ
jgi:hypothetical protein